jgi:hypothetical protein
MKYETPEMTALTPAIKAIQSGAPVKSVYNAFDGTIDYEAAGVYADWE